MFKQLFFQDVARWIEPGKVRPVSEVNPLIIRNLLYTHLPLRAMAWLRYGSWCKEQRIRVLPGYIQRLIMRRYGLEITVSKPIGGGLYIPHPVGVVVAPESMGQNCSIIAAVTIGMRNEWKFPQIGNDVFIGAGARVLGGITIGNGAIIGANAVVIHDVAPHTTVVGIPARPVGQKQTNDLLVFS